MKKVYSLLLVALILLSSILFYKSFTNPIKIALIGNFEEERYDFSTSSIIAARIAEKDINDKLGIRGRKTQLIVKNDDFTNPQQIIEFLKGNKIEAIITTATSQELLNIKSYLDDNKIICVTAGATSTEFSKQDDYMYSLMSDDEKEVDTFSKYLIENNLSRDIIIIYSKDNVEYKKSVEKNLKKLGNTIASEDTWEGNSVQYSPKNIEVMKDKTILILASARDTAFILQKLSMSGVKSNAFGLSWSGGENLKSYGGRVIEGFKFVTSVEFDKAEGIYGELTKKLQDYGKDNGLLSRNVYEAYNILKKAYEVKYEEHVDLKSALDSIKVFNNLSEELKFDKYGDISRMNFMYTVQDGKFIREYKEGQNESAKN
jgi:branched-chain amino acid transport system substrate-binding protein